MKRLLILIVFTLSPLTLFAQDAIYISGLLGLGKTSVNQTGVDFNTELNIGLRAGVLFNDNVSAGIFFLRSNNETSINTNTVSSDFNPMMAEVTYYFNVADEDSFYISGLLGVAKLGTVESKNETAVGASAGYHFMVAPNFSLGPQVLFVKTLGELDKDASLVSALFNITVWF